MKQETEKERFDFMKRRVLTLVLALVMLCSLVPAFFVTASAISADFSLTQGVYADDTFYNASGDIIHYDISGSIPGMSIGSNGSGIKLMGTPTTAGNFSMSLTVYIRRGEEELTEHITLYANVKPGAVTLSTVTKNYTVGDTVNVELNSLSTGGELFDGSYSGTLPTGVNIHFYDSSVAFDGQVTLAGTYTVKVSVFDDFSGGWRNQTVVFNVKDAVVLTTPIITKHPTGEIVTEGGSAKFIAYANDAEKIVWYLVSGDGTAAYTAADAPKYFPGLTVTGTDTETLTLKNIPLTLNGWQAMAKFIGSGGDVWTNGAKITVKKAPPKAPEITVQPVDLELEEGADGTLTVKAESPDGVNLTYQWYRNASDSNEDGEAIPGATDSVYHLEFSEEAVYYYCVVQCVEKDQKSDPVATRAARVIFTAEETEETTEATTEAATEPEEETAPSEETKPVKQETDKKKNEEKDSGFPVWALILIIIVGVLALIAATVLITVMILKKKKEEK